ncbi:hypothetical protein PFICI_14817 [Pestalotiopsis fici W106-1]|uniref:Zn(2)-C6 fungal-type domain-containing protein n=1 Tax=Pestalotiopsis fici (strain W106-1 / CGMCC3.15140) TaxID=1229662 RepID=W3WM39_PESFW|nr:uncharacterized protein PFICI_14817 [Pestalotiopsis fici W106-1]ETS73871.1 hypothetical protein PFICI_14817 [Pestalotiopsis fici W106-1]
MSQSPAENDRRRQPKSKTGCRTCKKRKVKCDESRPACRKCVKHGVKCDFIALSESDKLELPSPLHQPYTYHHESGGFTINDLELLHHYDTSTCLTLTTEPLTRNFWRVNIPQIGFTTPYILKGVLAVAALHLARYRPERKDFYTTLAFHHHNAALAQASPLITKVDTDNCVNLFLFSTITYYFAFGKPRSPTDFFLADNDAVPDWLYLFRGVRALMESTGKLMRASSIAFIFEEGIKMHRAWEALEYENEGFQELQRNIQASVGTHEPAKLRVLLDAVETLRKSYAVVHDGSQSDENKSRGVFVWVYKISDFYVDLVSAGDNEALCVLAYFCVLLRRLDFMWWIEGWGLHLIERIYARLNDKYRLWIRWPIEEIGWVPSY